MTPAEMHETLARVGWSRREFARRIGLSEGAVRQWVTVPQDVATWLRRLAVIAEQAPAPRRG